MHILNDREAHLLIKFALHKLSPGILLDLRGSAQKRETALEIAATLVLNQMKLGRHQIVQSARPESHRDLAGEGGP